MGKKQWVAFAIGGGGNESSPTKVVSELMNRLGVGPGEVIVISVPLKYDAGGVQMSFGLSAYVDPMMLRPEEKKQIMH